MALPSLQLYSSPQVKSISETSIRRFIPKIGSVKACRATDSVIMSLHIMGIETLTWASSSRFA